MVRVLTGEGSSAQRGDERSERPLSCNRIERAEEKDNGGDVFTNTGTRCKFYDELVMAERNGDDDVSTGEQKRKIMPS